MSSGDVRIREKRLGEVDRVEGKDSGKGVWQSKIIGNIIIVINVKNIKWINLLK